MGIDVWDVINGAATIWVYAVYHSGLGGHCIPIDPFYRPIKRVSLTCLRDLLNLPVKLIPICLAGNLQAGRDLKYTC